MIDLFVFLIEHDKYIISKYTIPNRRIINNIKNITKMNFIYNYITLLINNCTVRLNECLIIKYLNFYKKLTKIYIY